MIKSVVIVLIIGTIFSLAIVAYIIYIAIESSRSGDWKLLLTRIVYLVIIIIGLTGLTLTTKYVIKNQHDVKYLSTFQITEGDFIRSNESLVSTTDESDKFTYKKEYTYIYEYLANGKPYEYLHDKTRYPLKEPKKESLKKIILRYNPENPEEVVWLKHDIGSLITGFVLIGIAVLLFFVIRKMSLK